MSTGGGTAQAPWSSAAAAPAGAGAAAVKPKAPTTYIHYEGKTVKTRIDHDVPLHEIIRQLCLSPQLSLREPSSLFALRTNDDGVLVSDDNLASVLSQGAALKLCYTPQIEATDYVDKLRSHDAAQVKLATFHLRTFIDERAFAKEFSRRGGIAALAGVVRGAQGNTLAYALVALQKLLESDHAFNLSAPLDEDDDAFESSVGGGAEVASSDSATLRTSISATAPKLASTTLARRMIELVARDKNVNVVRPATAILKTIASHRVAPPPPSTQDHSPTAGTGSGEQAAAAGGFPLIKAFALEQPSFLRSLVQRINSIDDLGLAALSLELLNALLSRAIALRDLSFFDALEALRARDAVAALGKDDAGGELVAAHLAFAHNHTLALRLMLETPVSPQEDSYLLETIATRSREAAAAALDEDIWGAIGFVRTQDPAAEFERTNLLGLRLFERFAVLSPFAQYVKTQLAREQSRRCMLPRLCDQLASMLCDLCGVRSSSSSAPSSSSTTSRLSLHFFELHRAVMDVAVARLWAQANAHADDDARLVLLLQGLLSTLVPDKAFDEIKGQLSRVEYRALREQHLKKLETDDEMMSKPSIQALRSRLHLEAFEFVKAQRTACLLAGAWFALPSSSAGGGGGTRRTMSNNSLAAWRYCRLAPSKKAVHWADFAERSAGAPPPMDSLHERVELAKVTSVSTSVASKAPAGRVRYAGPTSPLAKTFNLGKTTTTDSAPTPSSSRTVVLLSGENVLLEMTATSSATCAEWVDGLSLLLPGGGGGGGRQQGGGGVTTRESREMIEALTETMLTVKLLDITGERIELREHGVRPPPPPLTVDFFYSNEF